MLISIISQVATAYVTWLGDRDTLALADTTLANQQDTLNLTRTKYAHGEENLLTVRQAETQVQQSAALRADSRRKVEQDENLISLLIGAPIPTNLPPARPLGEQTLLADLPRACPQTCWNGGQTLSRPSIICCRLRPISVRHAPRSSRA